MTEVLKGQEAAEKVAGELAKGGPDAKQHRSGDDPSKDGPTEKGLVTGMVAAASTYVGAQVKTAQDFYKNVKLSEVANGALNGASLGPKGALVGALAPVVAASAKAQADNADSGSKAIDAFEKNSGTKLPGMVKNTVAAVENVSAARMRAVEYGANAVSTGLEYMPTSLLKGGAKKAAGGEIAKFMGKNADELGKVGRFAQEAIGKIGEERVADGIVNVTKRVAQGEKVTDIAKEGMGHLKDKGVEELKKRAGNNEFATAAMNKAMEQRSA